MFGTKTYYRLVDESLSYFIGALKKEPLEQVCAEIVWCNFFSGWC